MASALVRGVLKAGVCQPKAVWASDCFFELAQKLASDTGLQAVRSNLEVAEASQTLLLCVKPQDSLSALVELRAALEGKLVVSIAAGVSLAALEGAAGPECESFASCRTRPHWFIRGHRLTLLERMRRLPMQR